MRLILAFIAAAALFFIAAWTLAYARPPENADPALAPWFKSLHTPSGVGCCSIADCRPVEYRIEKDHFEALIGKQFGDDVNPHWEPVPPDHILQNTRNPTGRAVACWLPYLQPHILCFVLPSMV
jgi:hypothetical protein